MSQALSTSAIYHVQKSVPLKLNKPEQKLSLGSTAFSIGKIMLQHLATKIGSDRSDAILARFTTMFDPVYSELDCKYK